MITRMMGKWHHADKTMHTFSPCPGTRFAAVRMMFRPRTSCDAPGPVPLGSGPDDAARSACLLAVAAVAEGTVLAGADPANGSLARTGIWKPGTFVIVRWHPLAGCRTDPNPFTSKPAALLLCDILGPLQGRKYVWRLLMHELLAHKRLQTCMSDHTSVIHKTKPYDQTLRLLRRIPEHETEHSIMFFMPVNPCTHHRVCHHIRGSF